MTDNDRPPTCSSPGKPRTSSSHPPSLMQLEPRPRTHSTTCSHSRWERLSPSPSPNPSPSPKFPRQAWSAQDSPPPPHHSCRPQPRRGSSSHTNQRRRLETKTQVPHRSQTTPRTEAYYHAPPHCTWCPEPSPAPPPHCRRLRLLRSPPFRPLPRHTPSPTPPLHTATLPSPFQAAPPRSRFPRHFPHPHHGPGRMTSRLSASPIFHARTQPRS